MYVQRRQPLAPDNFASPWPDTVPRRGLGASTGTDIIAGSGAVGASVAAGSAIAAGAAIGSVVPLVGTAIGALVGAAAAIFGGGGTPDQMKNIWDVVPFSLIRLSGGHGVWTDTLTGQQLTDAQSDLRKSAVVASAISAFNDPKNWWYDQTTQQYLSGASALQRWQQRFGNLSFANAYAMYPTAFQIFGPDPSADPQIRAPGVPAAPPVLTTAPTASNPLLSSTATPQQIANATPAQVAQANALAASMTTQQASLLGGLSGNTLLLVGGGLLVGLLLMRRSD